MRFALLLPLLLGAFLPALAAGPTAPPAGGEAVAEADEPGVQRTVIENDKVRIDELRVRGQLQRVVVSPKGRAPDDEIVVPDGSRDLSDGVSATRGAAGKRVWNLLRF